MPDERDAMDSGESNEQPDADTPDEDPGVAVGVAAAGPSADNSGEAISGGAAFESPEGAHAATDVAAQPAPPSPTPNLQMVTRNAYILETFESMVTWMACPNGMQAISGGYDGLPDSWSASRSTPARDASGALNGAWAFRFHGPAPGAPVGLTLVAFCTPTPIITD